MKKMLETAFPGIDVILANYPPPLPKRLLAKVVPLVQIGVIGIIVAGEHIFPMLGFMTPPPWYYSLRANRFGSMASTWLLGNVLQSFLQSSGAFEVFLNGDLVSVYSICYIRLVMLIFFTFSACPNLAFASQFPKCSKQDMDSMGISLGLFGSNFNFIE